MKGWLIHETGEPREHFRFGDIEEVAPGEGEVSVDVEKVGLSFPDLLLVRGGHQISLPLPCSPCSEIVGRISRVGANVSMSVGDRVMGLANPSFGALRQRTLASERDLSPLGSTGSLVQAAALPCNYVTAHLALHRRARLQAGEVVVIHGASGGVGSAALQLALAAQAKVIASDLGEEKTAFCRRLGAHLAVDISMGPAALTAAVKSFTKGQGADLVIDMVGGDQFDESRRYIASEGRIVIVGFMGGRIAELRTNQLLLKNYTAMGLNAALYLQAYPDIHREARMAVIKLLAEGKIDPVIQGEYPFDKVLDAFELLARGAVMGKVVIDVCSLG